MKIHAALMSYNELPDLIANLRELEPHVHTITVVDGGSTDGTIPYLRNWSTRPSGAKIRLFIHPWADNFPAQRNNYLRRVREIAEDGDWVLAFDPDEFLDAEARNALPGLIEQAERLRHPRVSFRCRSVSYSGPDRVWSHEDDYRKGLLFRWSLKLAYGHDGEGPVHETLRGLSGPDMALGLTRGTTALCYEHRKQENVIWPRGVRNYFCGGGGPNLGSANPRWVELKIIADRLGLATWGQMHAYLLGGNIDGALRAWIVEHRHATGWDGASEQREWFKTYFRLYHPEEEPEEMRAERIE